MKIKDLFGVLLTSQDVSLYNACGILEWVGEFKHMPPRYFECIINYMYSNPMNDRGGFIVINLKNIQEDEGRICNVRSISRSSKNANTIRTRL